MKLSIIIPAYNEELRIPAMLDAYLEHFTGLYPDNVEFIVVVNGSTDGTPAVVRDYEVRHPEVRSIIESKPIGKGGAIMRGFAAATGDLVGFSDADGATPPGAFENLITNLGHADGIIASRWLRDSNVHPRQPWQRLLASRVFNKLVCWFFKLDISDTQCGAKLFRREAIREVLPRLGVTAWAFDVDLLFQLRRAGYHTIEIPTTWNDIRGSKVRVVHTSLEMFAAICRLRLLYSPFRGLVSLYNIFAFHRTRLIRKIRGNKA